MIFETRPRRDLTLAIIPMIDIAYIIITFFLVFCVFRGTDASLRLRLPRAATAQDGTQAPVVITVTPEGEFVIPGGTVSDERLKGFLQTQLAGHPEQAVVIKADRDNGLSATSAVQEWTERDIRLAS